MVSTLGDGVVFFIEWSGDGVMTMTPFFLYSLFPLCPYHMKGDGGFTLYVSVLYTSCLTL